jgi:hypothetical protein
MKRYFDANARYGQITARLDGPRRRNADAPKFPPEITKARTDLEADLAAALRALPTKDFDEAAKQLESAEDNLTTLEAYATP